MRSHLVAEAWGALEVLLKDASADCRAMLL